MSWYLINVNKKIESNKKSTVCLMTMSYIFLFTRLNFYFDIVSKKQALPTVTLIVYILYRKEKQPIWFFFFYTGLMKFNLITNIVRYQLFLIVIFSIPPYRKNKNLLFLIFIFFQYGGVEKNIMNSCFLFLYVGIEKRNSDFTDCFFYTDV